MKILVVNSGSSSLKFDVFELDSGSEQSLFKGLVEDIGGESPRISYKNGGKKTKPFAIEAPDHTVALDSAIKIVQENLTPDGKFVPDAIGHRVVHGGQQFKSMKVDEDIISVIEKNSELAPLHNPPNLLGIRACIELFPETPNVAVFDTAFHHSMPDVARQYALPKELTEKYEIYRYGFHGTSHRFVAHKCAEFIGRDVEKMNIITCHLGNGASLTAVKNGKSIDTTMGFTPLEGVMMGTRTGDIDPGVVFFLMEKEGLSCDEINTLLNKKSGMLGVSGISNDIRPVEEAMEKGDKSAQFAVDIYAYKIKRSIGSLAAALNGVDAIVFTAGIGENDDIVRKTVCSGMEYLGVKLDEERNAGRKGECTLISADDSKCTVVVIPTDEELAIARDTLAVLKG